MAEEIRVSNLHASEADVAFRLMTEVMKAEDKVTYQDRNGHAQRADRKYILDLMAECVRTIRRPQDRL